jgi:hypothetical protein
MRIENAVASLCYAIFGKADPPWDRVGDKGVSYMARYVWYAQAQAYAQNFYAFKASF